MQKTIFLQPDQYIGRGLHRECYTHPTESNKCIKINYNVGADIETNREIKYYNHLTKRHIIWDSLSKYYGSVETNLGVGHVFDLIRDENNEISTSLETFIKQNRLNPQELEELVIALKNLKASLCKNRIITMTIKTKNILYQRKSSGNRLVIIDNIGNAKLIKIDNYCNWFAQRAIIRKWERFINTLTKENTQVAKAYLAKD